MKLSIIVPVFNEKHRVADFLDKMKKQTVAPEIVLVDGGSKDGTIELIKEYQKRMKNVKLFSETGEFRSPANARNIGLKKASGEIAHMVDIDGGVEDDFTKKVTGEFEKHKDFDVIRFLFRPMKPATRSWIQEAFYYRDTGKSVKYTTIFLAKRELIPKLASGLGYGEDKIWYREFMKVTERVPFYSSKLFLSYYTLGPLTLKEVWKRYKWYGRTGMFYYSKSHDTVHLLKMILAVLSVPFIPLMIIPMVRGLLYALRVTDAYPIGLITIPFLESIAFPAMAVGYWQYASGKSRKQRGH